MIIEDVFNGHGVEVSLVDNSFLKIAETLTRIGIASRDHNVLFQSCHILHKKGRYAIVHFKEMYSLDGKYSTLSDEDISRRDSIARLLQDWGLLKIVNERNLKPFGMRGIRVISHDEKDEWSLEPKYRFKPTNNKGR